MNENKNSKKGIIIGVVCLVVIAAIGGVIGFTKGKKDKTSEPVDLKEIAYSTQAPVQGELQEQTDIPINFEEIKKRNSDIYAWIKIDDTVIDYPILQSTSDPEDYYLDHTVDRANVLPGAIYTRMTSPKDFSGGNTIVYGHNMKDGTMFKGLHKYEDRSYFDSHPYIMVYTPDKSLKYEVFAAVTYDDVVIDKAFDCSTEAGLTDFIKSLKDRRNMTDQFKDEVEIKEGDKLITLSTCIANQPNNRYIVVAVLRNEE